MPQRPVPLLTEVEARLLAVLVEKQHTVPDTYPLSLNALVAGCNQKTSREPVMQVSEADARTALDSLRRASLVIESSGGRVMRYAQNAKRVLEVPGESIALLATLMLRGPQTAGELRLNAERLHRFSDISAVEGYLHEMAERPAGALVVELPRQPGTRETRWAHLLCGPHPDASADPVDKRLEPRDRAAAGLRDEVAPRREPSAPDGPDGELARLASQVDRLEREVASLRAMLERLLDESATRR
jgi:uncharacterized protein